MSWERRTKKREHTCDRPNAAKTERKRADVGDIWKCWRCGTRWELTYKGIPSANRAGPIHENTWHRIIPPGTPREPKPMPRNPEPMIPAPHRQTGTDWLYTEPENARRS